MFSKCFWILLLFSVVVQEITIDPDIFGGFAKKKKKKKKSIKYKHRDFTDSTDIVQEIDLDVT